MLFEDETQHLLDSIQNLFAKEDSLKRYICIRLPRRSFLLPVAPSSIMVESFSLYNPINRRGQWFKKILIWGIKEGVLTNLLPQISLNLGRLEVFFPQSKNETGLWFSLSLGSHGPHRTPVIQALSNQGQSLGYAKIGLTPIGKILVQNEATALNLLHRLGLKHLVIPFIWKFEDTPDYVVLVTHPIKAFQNERRFPKSIQEMNVITNMLAELFQLDHQDIPFTDTPYWGELLCRLQKLRGWLPDNEWRLIDQATQKLFRLMNEELLPCCWRLGDLTPWNIVISEQKVHLVDLENAKPKWIAGWDAMHYARACGWKIATHTIESYSMVLQFLDKVKIPREKVHVLHLAYLLDRYTEWAVAWKEFNQPLSPSARQAFKKLLTEIEILATH